MEGSDLYRSSSIIPPTTEELRAVAEKAYLHISDEDLLQYKAHTIKVLSWIEGMDRLIEPRLPTKYSSTSYVPAPADNKYNAWARITNTKGAPTGKLAGKKIAIKDNIHLAGVPLTCGSNFTSGLVSDCNATVVERILDAGGEIKGKTTCEDMCFDGSSYTSATGPVLNPHDPTRSTGGSSSGNAVVISTGEVDMAVGTDQAGSIRMPSSWTGIVGLKPTHGLVPYTGILGMEASVDFVGPMAKTVYDCALLLEVIAGYNGGLDPRQPINLTVPNYTELLTRDIIIKGLRVGLLKEGFDGSEPDVEALVKSTARKLELLGVTVEELSFPGHNDASVTAAAIGCEGTYHTYRNGGIEAIGSKGFKDTMVHEVLFSAAKTKADRLPPTVKVFLLMYGYITEKYGCRFYAKARNIMRGIVTAYDELFKKYDVLIMPTIKFKAQKLPNSSMSIEDYLAMTMAIVGNTSPYNGTGHPALSINCGFSEGLPVGLMIVGRHFEELTVLKVAQAIEKLRGAG